MYSTPIHVIYLYYTTFVSGLKQDQKSTSMTIRVYATESQEPTKLAKITFSIASSNSASNSSYGFAHNSSYSS